MIVLLLGLSVGIVILAITCLIIYARWNYGVLESGGIPVVKPCFIFGSQPLTYTKVIQQVDLQRFKEFGPVYGVYEGRLPRIFVSDPEMVRLIHVKDFDYFYDRTHFEMGDSIVGELLDFLPAGLAVVFCLSDCEVEEWKVIRSQLTPLFTSGRIKHQGKIIQGLIDEYINDVSAKMKEGNQNAERMKFDMKDFMITFIVDATAKSFLGIVLPDRKDPENYLVKLIKQMMFEDLEVNFFMPLLETFPFLHRLIPKFQMKGVDTFVSTIEKIISLRRKSGRTENDFIQILIDMLDKLDTPEYKRLKITKNTVYAQALEFFIAGYDTMANTMSLLSYYLAKNPDVQNTLLQELDGIIEKTKDGHLDHDVLENADYLTACLMETVRLSPPFPRLERLCTKDWSYKNFRIKKGTSVIVPSWVTNRNPEYFENPENFNPRRYIPDNKRNINAYAMTSFGFGPRSCIGQRLAYENLKLISARCLKEFRFEAREDTDAKLVTGLAFITRYHPICVDLVRRERF